MDQAVLKPRTGNKIQSPKVVRRRDQMRQTLIAAGSRQFSERGFGNVSVEDLIEDAGISRRTFYGFFANKHEIAAALINPIFDSAVKFLKTTDKRKTDPVVPQIIQLYLDLWSEHKDALLLLNTIDGDVFPYIEKGHSAYTRQLKKVLHRAEEAGELRNDSAQYSFRVMTRVAVGMLKVYHDHPDQAALYRDAMTALLSK